MAIMTNGYLQGSLPRELKTLIVSLAANWGDVMDDWSHLQVIPLKGAMTNEVYQISWPTTEEGSRRVLLRVYGEGVDVFFNRDEEIRTFECVSEHGHGPRLLGRFPQGRVEEFIHARTLSASDLRDPEISRLVAAKLRDFHNLDMPGARKPMLWDRIRNWLKEAKHLCSAEDAAEFRLAELEEEVGELENALPSDEGQQIGFCHNDLQYGNIMMDEETKAITLIDYEYASYNPTAYDIANHFCEMAADYHTDTPHILDYAKYPGLEERRDFVQSYLTCQGTEPTESEVEKLVEAVEKYKVPNHLFWGLWGLISSYVNNIEFNYTEYAGQRFQQYWLTRRWLLA
uniref:Choline kinase n=1 Tax=Kalanchoe fedtschenkoi TaxID=63787 RepID=A0A7N0U727_KALFE